MATLSGFSPNAERLSNLIRNSLRRGIRPKTIIKEAKKQFGRFARKTIEAITTYWQQTFSLASKATKAKKDDRLVDYTVDKQCRRPKVIRVGYTLEFYDPNTDEMKTFGGFADFDILTGIEAAKKKILGQTIDVMIKHYEYSNITKATLDSLYSSLEFQTIECVTKGE